MRGKTLAGTVTTLIVAVGLASMAQGPPEPNLLPPPPTEESKAPPEQIGFTPDAPPLPGAAPDDPMQDVEAFVQRNRKEADEAIKALTQERDSLRARLQKVETALGRWKAVAGALEQRQVADPSLPPLDDAPETPQPVDIIPPTVPAP
jgi:hypothetical protein